MGEQNDCEDQGFSDMSEGCNVCPNKGWTADGTPVRYAIVPRGRWMCCEKCGGSYGIAPPVAQQEGSTQ